MNELVEILSEQMWESASGTTGALRQLACSALETLAAEHFDADTSLALTLIGPTGTEERICQVPPADVGGADAERPTASHELFVEQGSRRVLIGRLEAQGPGTFPAGREADRDLVAVTRALRQRHLQGSLRATRAHLMRHGAPAKLRKFDELGEALTVLGETIATDLADYGVLCYLRRAYLPHSDQRAAPVESSIHASEPAAALGSSLDWQRFWDGVGEKRVGRQEIDAMPGGEGSGGENGAALHHHGLPLVVPEYRHSDSEDESATYRFFGALSFFSGEHHGFLASEIALLKSFAAALSYIVRDCEIFHGMGLHDQLLFDLNLISNPQQVLERAAGWYLERYGPTEIAILRLNHYQLSLVYNHGIDPASLPTLDIREEPGAVLSCARSRQIDYMPDIQAEKNYLCVNEATRSQIAVPLYIGEMTLGVLLLGFPVVDALSGADRLLISASSFRIASALLSAQRAEQGALVAHKLKEILPLFRDNLSQISFEPGAEARSRRAIARMQTMVETWEPRIIFMVRNLSQEAAAARQIDTFCLRELLEDLAEATRSEADARGIEVDIVVEAGEPQLIRGDRRSVWLAFESLIANAADAIAQGGGSSIRLETSERTSRDDLLTRKRRLAVVTVTDDGPGIAPEDVPRIFEPIFSTKGGSSTGLGLFIARGILEGEGGTLDLVATKRTEPARSGATFEATLPLEEEA